MNLLLNPKKYTGKYIVKYLPPTEGIQKVGGFSRGRHHSNSLRLGIRNETLPQSGTSYYPLYLYAWIDGKPVSKRITITGALVGDVVEYELKWGKTSVFAEINIRRNGELIPIIHNSTFIKKADKWTIPIGYELYEYFEEDGRG